MKREYIITAICLLLILPFGHIAAQTDSTAGVVKYTPDFRFRDGFYLNFDQVKNNRPIPKSRILTSMDYSSKTFFDDITELKSFTYFDDLGNSLEVATSTLWGYSKNGILYINVANVFNRITIVGSICHFVATVTTSYNRYSPYGYSPYGYSPYSYGYNPYGYGPYGYGSPNYRTTELKQFLLSFTDGQIVEYDVKNVAMLLMTDPELHDEFEALRSKKKQQLRFMYIRKFNERHPLYIGR
jgi:hypothetical protein